MLGVEPGKGPLAQQALSLVARAAAANPWTLVIGLGVLAIMLAGERLSPRFPGALIGLCLAELATIALGLEARGVATLGSLAGAAPHLSLPMISWDEFRVVAPLAVLIALVVMVQTAATTRAFPDGADGPDVNRDFIGVGAANALRGLIGAFPVDASPPNTAIAAESGAQSQLAAADRGGARARRSPRRRARRLRHMPSAALAGVLLFVALRLVRIGVIARRVATKPGRVSADPRDRARDPGAADRAGRERRRPLVAAAWRVDDDARAQAIEFERIPGTSIWWPRDEDAKGEFVPGVRVIALQAPLSFLNAYNFRRAIERFASQDPPPKLIVIEANALVEIDYTGATVLAELIRRLRGRGVDVAVARLESVRAQESFARLGLFALIGHDHVFRSVQEAIDALRRSGARLMPVARTRYCRRSNGAMMSRSRLIGLAPGARRRRGFEDLES